MFDRRRTAPTDRGAARNLVLPSSIALAGRLMYRASLLVSLLFGCALWLGAQEGIPGADIWRAPAGPSTVEGCLQSSNTHYTVTTADGRVTRLTGNTAWLSRYVGHEVEVNGKPTVITLDTTVSKAASTVEQLRALDVKSAKEISKTCAAAP